MAIEYARTCVLGEPERLTRQTLQHPFSLLRKRASLAGLWPGGCATHKLHVSHVSDYFDKGLHIKNPKIFYDPEGGHSITDVISTPDELILVTDFERPSYQWMIGYSNAEIEVDGVRYKATKTEGMEGFETTYFWSPTWGCCFQTLHFPPIPKSVKTIDFHDDNPANTKRMIQVTDDDSFMNDVRSIRIGKSENLKSTHLNDDDKDYFRVDRVDFFKDKTVVNCAMHIRAPHSFPGYVGNDFTLTLADGRVMKALRIDGVPVEQEFDRHGDWISTPFQVVFPQLSEAEWNAGDESASLHGSILHEPMTIMLTSVSDYLRMVPVTALAEGEYKASIKKRARLMVGDQDLGWYYKESYDVQKCTVNADGSMTIKGDPTRHLKDGTYAIQIGGAKKVKNTDCSSVRFKMSGTSLELDAYNTVIQGKLLQTVFETPTEVNGVQLTDDDDVWALVLQPN